MAGSFDIFVNLYRVDLPPEVDPCGAPYNVQRPHGECSVKQIDGSQVVIRDWSNLREVYVFKPGLMINVNAGSRSGDELGQGRLKYREQDQVDLALQLAREVT